MAKRQRKTADYHIYPIPKKYKIEYNHSSSLYEIQEARSTYKMPFNEMIDLKCNLHQYGSVLKWYQALPPESRMHVQRIIQPAPKRKARVKQGKFNEKEVRKWWTLL